MLTHLSIKNFSVIDSASLDFAEGLTVFTGETGAGKTVLINAVKMLIGEKLSKSYFRDENKPIKIEGIFTGDFSYIPDEIRDEFEIDDQLVVKREIDFSGKNKIIVNGSAATAKQLRDILAESVDIHGQHDHQNLLNQSNHINYIDSLIDPKIIADFHSKYLEYSQAVKMLEDAEKLYNEMLRKKDSIDDDLLRIRSANISIKDDILIDDKIIYLSNLEKIQSGLANTLELLKYGEINSSSLLSSAKKELTSIADFHVSIEDVLRRLDNISYDFSDCCRVLEELSGIEDVDPAELDKLISRKDALDKLKKNYGGSLESVLEYESKMSALLDSLFSNESDVIRLKENAETKKITALASADILNRMRVEISGNVSKMVEEILQELELKNTRFIVKMSPLDILDFRGGADIEFFISTNIGFEPMPLAKVASGGEISRVMLALKEIFSRGDNARILIFDEIDTGISGVTAKKVADKLKSIALEKQVIVITHLPVVAGRADRHFHLSKDHSNEITKTNIRLLDEDDKVYVVASMISGDITDSSIMQAKELIR